MDGRVRRRVDVPLRHERRRSTTSPTACTAWSSSSRRMACRRSTTEFALVQSEWYLGPQGKATDLAKAMAAAPAPDFVVFNGVANQYKDHPLQVGTGETRADLRPRRRAEHRQLVPHRRDDLQHGHQGGRHARRRATPATGAARPWTSPRRRARSSSSRPPRTASTRSSPTRSTSSGAARLGLVQAGDGDPKN